MFIEVSSSKMFGIFHEKTTVKKLNSREQIPYLMCLLNRSFFPPNFKIDILSIVYSSFQPGTNFAK